MKLLIAYGSAEGQTRKISENVAAHVRAQAHECTLYDTERRIRGLDIDGFDSILVASSVHQELHQISVRDFAAAHLQLLEAKPSAFLSVSLSAAVPDGDSFAQKYVDHFFETTGWHPRYFLKVAGALRYSDYDFFKEQVLRHVVFKDRPNEILLGRDHEFTDWDAVYEFVDTFTRQASIKQEIDAKSVGGRC